MFSREHSLLSATYKKSARPAIVRNVFQVSMWVRESLVLPSVQRKATGTWPSAVMVRMNSNCFKSGRWAFECPKTTAGAVRPRMSRPVAAR